MIDYRKNTPHIVYVILGRTEIDRTNFQTMDFAASAILPSFLVLFPCICFFSVSHAHSAFSLCTTFFSPWIQISIVGVFFFNIDSMALRVFQEPLTKLRTAQRDGSTKLLYRDTKKISCTFFVCVSLRCRLVNLKRICLNGQDMGIYFANAY